MSVESKRGVFDIESGMVLSSLYIGPYQYAPGILKTELRQDFKAWELRKKKILPFHKNQEPVAPERIQSVQHDLLPIPLAQLKLWSKRMNVKDGLPKWETAASRMYERIKTLENDQMETRTTVKMQEVRWAFAAIAIDSFAKGHKRAVIDDYGNHKVATDADVDYNPGSKGWVGYTELDEEQIHMLTWALNSIDISFQTTENNLQVSFDSLDQAETEINGNIIDFSRQKLIRDSSRDES